jgi:hypothetical protein
LLLGGRIKEEEEKHEPDDGNLENILEIGKFVNPWM